MKPTTAVIFAAGIGTRMLPITAAVQKELLPIGNRPVIDYVVSDCVAAGITRIIFVIRPGQTGIKDYYLGNASLEENLKRHDKSDALALLESIHRQAKFEFVEQASSAGYGTAIPLQVAMPLLEIGEPVLVCGGDDFVWHSDGTSEIARFIDTFTASRSDGAIMSLVLPPDQLRSYGVLSSRQEGTYSYLTAINEKPEENIVAPSPVNISKYIFGAALRTYVSNVSPRQTPKESYITDAVTSAAKAHNIVVHTITGSYLDTGTPTNWLHANEVIASSKQ